MELKTAIMIIIPIVTVLISSNTFASELFTSFEIDTMPKDDSHTTIITIKNTGWLQAKNVVMHMTFDSPVVIQNTDCLEGSITHAEDSKIDLSFLRMSPNIECRLDMGKTNSTDFKAWIIADDRSAVYYPDSYIILDYLLRLATLFGVMIVLPIILISYGTYLLILQDLRSHKHKPIDCWKKIQQLVKETHGTRINKYDVSILCAIISHDKHTISEIKTHAKISKTYVKKRVQHMIKNDIILSDKFQVAESLHQKISDICSLDKK